MLDQFAHGQWPPNGALQYTLHLPRYESEGLGLRPGLGPYFFRELIVSRPERLVESFGDESEAGVALLRGKEINSVHALVAVEREEAQRGLRA